MKSNNTPRPNRLSHPGVGEVVENSCSGSARNCTLSSGVGNRLVSMTSNPWWSGRESHPDLWFATPASSYWTTVPNCCGTRSEKHWGDRRDLHPYLQDHNLPCVLLTPRPHLAQDGGRIRGAPKDLCHLLGASGWDRTNASGFSNQRFHQVSFRREYSVGATPGFAPGPEAL